MTIDQRQAAGECVRALAAWARSVPFSSIPDAIKRRAALILIDDLACAAGSRHEPELVALKSRLRPAMPESTVFLGDRTKLDRSDAAMINSIASNWCQLDEGHRQVMCHAGLYVVPAAAAEAEASRLSTSDVLRAVAVAYEVVCRLALAFRFTRPTAHPHALWSAVGSSVAISLLRSFDEARFLDAMTSAATMAAAGPFGHAVSGATIANAWCGVGVANGFAAARFAECGIGGQASSIFDVFDAVFGTETNLASLTDRIGEEWMLAGNYHKIHSCAQQSHASVEAVLQLRNTWPAGKGTQDITGVRVEAHPLALSMDNRNPATSLAARFSIPHIVATVCVYGSADPEAFLPATLANGEIVRLRSLVEMALREPALPPPHERAARVTITFNDERAITAECLSAEGGPDRPFSPARILQKSTELTREVYPAFGAVSSELCALQDSRIGQTWRDVAADLTSGVSSALRREPAA